MSGATPVSFALARVNTPIKCSNKSNKTTRYRNCIFIVNDVPL